VKKRKPYKNLSYYENPVYRVRFLAPNKELYQVKIFKKASNWDGHFVEHIRLYRNLLRIFKKSALRWA